MLHPEPCLLDFWDRADDLRRGQDIRSMGGNGFRMFGFRVGGYDPWDERFWVVPGFPESPVIHLVQVSRLRIVEVWCKYSKELNT